jgi:two-component system, cell cycle sensor histidine kinase and response regulator CckA
MPEGGVATISTLNVFLEKPVRGYDDVQAGEYAALIVSDTGQGISPDDLGTIFEPFCTRKAMGKSGTGLGLSVVWGTVQDHDGYIDVESEEGRGTTFSLYLPATQEALTEKRPPVPPERYRGKGETILVVDDVKEQRELAAAMLGKLNYRVASVSSGEEAVEYVKARQVDLLVLDMIMGPGIDGLETYRRILKTHPLQKAVIVSGFSETERVRQARELGSGVYLRKPYALESLGLAVRRELDIG